jgi:hypothetical protein
MIKGITNGPGLKILAGNTSLPYINMDPNSPIQGSLRIWGNDIQAWSGNNWMTINSSYATVQLDEQTLDLLDWARKKKQEEEMLISLPDDHPAVNLARQNVNRAKQALQEAEEQLKITTILSKDEKTTS